MFLLLAVNRSEGRERSQLVHIVLSDVRGGLEVAVHDGAARLVGHLVERGALVHAAARGLLAGAGARGHRVLGLDARARLHVVVQLLAPQQEERVVVLVVRHLLARRVLRPESQHTCTRTRTSQTRAAIRRTRTLTRDDQISAISLDFGAGKCHSRPIRVKR